MRLLITADTIGGVWTYTRELVSGLVRRGHEIILVSFGNIPAAQQTQWMEGLNGLDYRPTAFRLEWMQDPDLEASTEFLQSVIDEVKPELLHLNQYCYGAIRSHLPRVVVGHSDVVSWWVEVHGEEPPESEWLRRYRGTVSNGLAAASAVVAPSQWMLEQLGRYYAAPAGSALIHNGRSPLLLNPHISKDNAVLSVGRLWDAGKQVSLLLEAELPLPVWIAGDERDAKLGTSGKQRSDVQFKGVLSEAQIRHLFARAGIYAATSRYEPFGLAPLEAALSRCAIVANDIPPFREIWGDTVLYFQRNDASDLRAAIARLRDDDRLRLTYANLAYNHARKMFSADRMVEQYLGLYRQLTAKNTVGAASGNGASAA